MTMKIWIMNHYATNMFFKEGGRHYWFAKNLNNRGHEATIFCASTRHRSAEVVDLKGAKYSSLEKEGIPFIFVKASKYRDNGRSRIYNMVSFYRNLFPATKAYGVAKGKPDVVLASSVHPLTLVAGIKIAKRYGVPCICEIRDLWPESIMANGYIKRKGLLARLLYRGERWIYKKAHRLIFTVGGGAEYIQDKGWDNKIHLAKVFHINNGIDLAAFRHNLETNTFADPDLENDSFKVIYAGSIGLANGVKALVDSAKVVRDRGYDKIQFLIYGRGEEKEGLEKFCQANGIDNVKFKGHVEKKYIPFILSRGNLNIVLFKPNGLIKYGSSQNKMFDYFASGRPTLANESSSYSLIKKYSSGMVLAEGDGESFATGVIEFYKMPEEEYRTYCQNALTAARDFDFSILTDKLEAVIEFPATD